MNKFSFNVNNGRIIELTQSEHDGSISITKYNSKGNPEKDVETISADDFITVLNWYQYEKGKGNHNLDFE